MEKLYLPHTKECFVCGSENPVGIKHIFYVAGDFTFCDLFLPKGYDGVYDVIHGGVSIAVVDETMAWCAYIFSDAKNMFITREIKVKFKYPLKVDTQYIVKTKFVEKNKVYAIVQGYIIDDQGKNYLEAEGKFVETMEKNMYETAKYLVFDQERVYHPKSLALKKYIVL
jgi:hypothetical protein